MARRSLGRRKIAMRRMTNESNRLVTFSKRSTGLFKKASEICTLYRVKIAINVFSPAQRKVFSFGHPSLELVIDKFITPLNSNPAEDSGMLQLADPHLAELNGLLSVLHDQCESQTTTTERRQRQVVDWFETPVEDLGLEQLQILKSGLTELKTMVANRRNSLSLTQQAWNLKILSFEEGEQAGGAGAAFGIIMTPQGYALR